MRLVDDRVLLGLDKLYRDAMERYERTELLTCARRVSQALSVSPHQIPVEGYYVDDARLTEYFRLVRSLQKVDQSREPSLPAVSKDRWTPLPGPRQTEGQERVGCAKMRPV